MAKTTVRGAQIADGANGVDLTVDVTGVLPIANGGTGANTAAGAITNLGAVDTTNNQSIGGLKTFTGTGGIVSFNAAGAQIIAASASGAEAKLNLRSGTAANKTRWELTKNTTAESGSNVGSDLDLNAFNDSGSFLARVLRVTRSTQIANFTNRPTVGGTQVALASDLSTFTSGTYTPTATGVANVSVVNAGTFHYIRVGNEVSFSGYVSITPTAANTITQVTLTLPIASTLGSSTEDAAGTATPSGVSGVYGFVRSDGAGKLFLQTVTSVAVIQVWRVSGHYTIN